MHIWDLILFSNLKEDNQNEQPIHHTIKTNQIIIEVQETDDKEDTEEMEDLWSNLRFPLGI